MKKKILMVLVTTGLLIMAVGCSGKEKSENKTTEVTTEEITEEVTTQAEELEDEHEYLIEATIDSAAIGNNLIDEDTVQNLLIYLPPSYYESDKNYPVVYYLHGFGDYFGDYTRNNKATMDSYFEETGKEFIFVEVDGGNTPGGSYYVNSKVIGDWETYTTTEVVSYLDENYRTIADRNSRGVCGFSMGGFGAINLAFRHPDIYGAVYTMSPGIIAEGEMDIALDSWENDTTFLTAYSMAFSYSETDPYTKIPTRDGSAEDNAIIAEWENGYGNWEEKVDTYLALDNPLNAIGISYGSLDAYTWIPNGCIYFSDLMAQKDIEIDELEFTGGHMQAPVKDSILPFFEENLTWE